MADTVRTRTRPALAPVADTRSSPTATEQTRLIPVTRWNDHYEWPPIGGLRHLIFNSETNGFGSAFVRVGRRVLVDEAEFWRCVQRASRNGV